MINCLLHLSLLPGIGPATIHHIVQVVGFEQLSNLYEFSVADFSALGSISPSKASQLVVGLADHRLLERELLLAQKHSVRIVTIFEADYPNLLRQIYMPPPLLYIQGSIKNQHDALAIVGSRKAHHYAKTALQLLMPSLVEAGLVIVSGGALGADTFAHEAAIASGGQTVAVLGSGLLRPYPSENKKLFDSICSSGGALISSFALEQGPLPGNFPARNRIIAGLSKGCLVLQAAEKSGACITARFALDQGKEVFVVPGRIDDPLQVGGHRLIQQGAKLITSAMDILEEFDALLASRTVSTRTASAQARADSNPSEQEDSFVQLCSTPISTQELMAKTAMSLSQLNALLFDLQIEGKIEQDHAGLWHCL